MTPDLIVFDCDGVLVDWEPISNGVLAEMLCDQGLARTLPEARAAYQGLLLTEVLEKAEAELGRGLPEGWLARYEHRRAEAFEAELEAVEGAQALIEAALSHDVQVCVASQGGLEKTNRSLALTGLDHLFAPSARFSAHDVARGKPHPDLFLHAAATMAADRARCVVIEDTPSGVTAAVRAGMRVFGYAADSDRAALERAGAEAIDALSELTELLWGAPAD